MGASIAFDVVAHDLASRTLHGIGGELDRSVSKWGKLGSAIKSAAKVTAIGLLAATTIGVGFAKQAADDEVAVKQLALQIHNNTDATKTDIASVEDWIAAQGRAKGIADDDLRPALTRLVTATHDVGEAQKLASLAMDISAGSGKSLESTTMALVRATNGSVTGLSRMGIATKDAAGETLTFDQLQKNLAKTFGGAATKAAGTASGEYGRLRVILSETGEAIGYKLLPYATELGEWLVDTGTPAVEEFAGWLGDELGPTLQDISQWVRDNKDDLADLGAEIGSDIVPVLKTTVDVGREVLGFFMDLPDPIRKVGVELGIAALVFPRFKAGLAGVGLSAFNSDLDSSATKLQRFAAGARAAAGVAGMAALIDSTQQGNDAVGALEETLGGAAVGGSMFGPWGAAAGFALGGVHSAFKIMFGDVEQTGEVMADGGAAVEDYASTFDNLTGAITGATKQSVIHAAQLSGVLGQIDDFGISQRTLVNATLGQKDAIAQVNAALQQSRGLTIAYTDAWGGQHVMAAKSKRQADELTATLKAQGNTIDDVRMAGLDLAGSKAILDFIGEQTREWKSQSKETRAAILASQDLSSVYKAFPKTVATQIDATGIVPTAKGVAELAIKYDAMDKRHVQALIAATGTDLSVRQIQAVIDKINALHDKTVTITYAHRGSPGGPSDADTASGGGGGQATPRTSSRGGSGGIDYWHSGENATATSMHLMDSTGDLLDQLLGTSGRVHKAGDKLLDLVKADYQSKADKVAQLKQASADFAASFQSWASNPFGAQSGSGGPLTIQDLLSQSQGGVDTSAQVLADIQHLLAMGADSNMIQQLQAQGASGIEALHVLASASAEDVQTMIANSATTQKNYADAGVLAANKVYDGQIAVAEADAIVAGALVDVVAGIKNLKNVEFIIRDHDLVAVIDRALKDAGRK